MVRKKRQRKPAIEGDTSNLPCEVVYNILSRLPVKSLMRFRCACKPWRAVISEFAKMHLNESINLGRQRLLFSANRYDCFHSIDCDTTFDNSKDVLYFPLKRISKPPVLCSCNGLVLLGPLSDNMFVLWNPSTRAYKEFSCPYLKYLYNTVCGLCYDSLIDDYKVVLISSCSYYKTLFAVFTLKSNSWTETREFPYSTVCGENGVIANGALHWVVTVRRRNTPNYVSSDSVSVSEASDDSASDDSSDDNDDGRRDPMQRAGKGGKYESSSSSETSTSSSSETSSSSDDMQDAQRGGNIPKYDSSSSYDEDNDNKGYYPGLVQPKQDAHGDIPNSSKTSSTSSSSSSSSSDEDNDNKGNYPDPDPGLVQRKQDAQRGGNIPKYDFHLI